jgi:protein-L-isoaspartate(D-aspartate) O-methyltransferase
MGGFPLAAGLTILLASLASDSPGASGAPGSDPYAVARGRLLAEVALDVASCAGATGIDQLSDTVADALLAVPRHEFVPEELRLMAWDNRPLPIGLDQTISQPTIVALMTELLELAPTDTVLEVGTGSGYQAAVLATVLPLGRVHTIEILPALAEQARQRLRRLGYGNVEVVTGDGHAGLPAAAPFAGIMVTAVAPEVPPALLDQLAPGGRLVIPLADAGGEQWLTVVWRAPGGGWVRHRVIPVRFVPLTGDGGAR